MSGSLLSFRVKFKFTSHWQARPRADLIQVMARRSRSRFNRAVTVTGRGGLPRDRRGPQAVIR